MSQKRRKTKQPIVNKKKLVMCSSLVNRDAVKREVKDGVEHIIVSSYTLPDDVVMNGGLYPAEETEKSFQTLERTLAPVEHPTDGDGNFISASDPHAIHNFHAGAFNVNVKRDGGRVHIEKHINVQEALKSERGKRLLDRINELETNENPRPIHTSTGIFLEIEPLDQPVANAEGQEYSWIARNMCFDHDAILLDSVGAAQPHQGVGMAVNSEGEKIDIEYHLNADDKIVEPIVEHDDEPTYTPKVNSEEGEAMKEMILNALAEASVKTEGLDDTQLLAEYAKLQANQSTGDDAGATSDDLAEIVANAVTPLAEKISSLETQLNAKAESEKETYVETVVNSGKFPGLDTDSAKLLPVEKLKEMAANCAESYGLPIVNHGGNDNESYVASELPE